MLLESDYGWCRVCWLDLFYLWLYWVCSWIRMIWPYSLCRLGRSLNSFIFGFCLWLDSLCLIVVFGITSFWLLCCPCNLLDLLFFIRLDSSIILVHHFKLVAFRTCFGIGFVIWKKKQSYQLLFSDFFWGNHWLCCWSQFPFIVLEYDYFLLLFLLYEIFPFPFGCFQCRS